MGLLSLDVETRGLPPLAPPPRVCGEVYLTLPYLTCHGSQDSEHERERITQYSAHCLINHCIIRPVPPLAHHFVCVEKPTYLVTHPAGPVEN